MCKIKIIKAIPLLISVLLLSSTRGFCQSSTIYLKAHSDKIKILDGDDLREGGIDPALHPDVYVYHKTNKAKKIVYYTDTDSIAFDVKPGDQFDFAVILNDRDTCYQRISYINPSKARYSRPGITRAAIADTIPFILKKDNAIHIQGKINGSKPLDLIFDTGASLGVLTDKGQSQKAGLNNKNQIEFTIGHIVIANTNAVFINYNGRVDFDGVIGYNAFEDKVVEINYDQNILVISDAPQGDLKTYSTTDMKWRGENMFASGSIKYNDGYAALMYLFDTGSKWALSLTNHFAAENNLLDLSGIGTREGKGVNGIAIKSKTILLPELSIGNLVLKDVPADLELKAQEGGLGFNILGNDVLKRFNVVLDYKNGVIYLKKNRLWNTAYNKPFRFSFILIGGLAIVILVISYFFFKKKTARTSVSSIGN